MGPACAGTPHGCVQIVIGHQERRPLVSPQHQPGFTRQHLASLHILSRPVIRAEQTKLPRRMKSHGRGARLTARALIRAHWEELTQHFGSSSSSTASSKQADPVRGEEAKDQHQGSAQLTAANGDLSVGV